MVGIAAEASHPRGAALARGNHDPDASVQNEMHRIGGIAGADDNLAGVDLQALATMDQFRGVSLGPENPDEPVTQGGFLLLAALMLHDNLVLAPLQRVIEFGHDGDPVRDEIDRSQGLLGRRG